MNRYLKQIINAPFAVGLKFKPKIFVISFQRTGTTSTGKFFGDHNFRVANYSVSRRNEWTLNWFKGDYNRIFNSIDFQAHQVFEDDPWWCGNFYKVLFHRFPNSKFVLLERDPDRWFDSMVNHSSGKTLGNTYRHSKIYRREIEFYSLDININKPYSSRIDNLMELNDSHREHYKNIYFIRNKEIKEFFDQFDSERLIYAKLEDQYKWKKIGKFIGFNVDNNYNVHVNSSK